MTVGQRLTVTLSMLTIVLGACRAPWQHEPPGWRSPVSELFVDITAFPEGWQIHFPDRTVTDPTVNRVGRTWGNPDQGGTVNQGIWRAYDTVGARRKYVELNKNFLQPRTPRPGAVYVGFEPPETVDLHNLTADEFYLACGWSDRAYCVVFARYRNYVTSMYLTREAELNGRRTHGLTDPEIETVINAMDAKFEQFFASLATLTP